MKKSGSSDIRFSYTFAPPSRVFDSLTAVTRPYVYNVFLKHIETLKYAGGINVNAICILLWWTNITTLISRGMHRIIARVLLLLIVGEMIRSPRRLPATPAGDAVSSASSATLAASNGRLSAPSTHDHKGAAATQFYVSNGEARKRWDVASADTCTISSAHID